MTYQAEVGPAIPSVIFVVFVVLKLTGVIDWSWLWVASPLWIPAAVIILFLTLIAVPVGIYATYQIAREALDV